ncbi:MAG TPA: endonuclease domain-containing protein [Candidatus Omnitrophota bacterium]|mgnify:CR=1 FL=1|nr:endonuclease domain-containing protein [Candidatus Omnitrophota bacterium]
MLGYNKRLKSLARSLRKDMTNCERKIWGRLRGKQIRGLQFYRQKPIGNYIVDFYCPAKKIVIEIDGGQHFISPGRERDRTRDRFLETMGLRVLRFSDLDVMRNIDAVLETILDAVEKSPPAPL